MHILELFLINTLDRLDVTLGVILQLTHLEAAEP